MIFCASQPEIEDADQHLREVKSDIDALACAVFGPNRGTAISLCTDGKWMAYVVEKRPGYDNLAIGVHENLYDALYLLKRDIEAKREEAEILRRILNSTLGIDEPIMQEAAE